MKTDSDKPKIATAGKLEIAINHFTTDITQLPYWMDSNCYIVFSLLWRRYISDSINEKLITPDGWFQYTMKSLMEHSGFKDKGTLHRTVEGLYRSGLVDVRVEDGSRLWACWKMNKKNIEYVASIPDRDAMQEPYINSINTISSKDKNFTYQLNKEGITELMKFFMVNPVENPPLFNTITQYHYNTTSQYNNSTSLPYNYTTLPQQDFMEEVPSHKNNNEEMEKEFEKPVEENPIGLQAEESSTQSSNEYQSCEKELQQGQRNVSKDTLEKARKEFREFKKDIDPELAKLKDCSTKDELSAAVKQFYLFLNQKLDESNFSHEAVRKQVESYVFNTIDTLESQLFWH